MLSEIYWGKSAQTLYHTEVQKDWFVQRKLFTCVQGCYYLLVHKLFAESLWQSSFCSGHCYIWPISTVLGCDQPTTYSMTILCSSARWRELLQCWVGIRNCTKPLSDIKMAFRVHNHGSPKNQKNQFWYITIVSQLLKTWNSHTHKAISSSSMKSTDSLRFLK
jgi:hypothetical protein